MTKAKKVTKKRSKNLSGDSLKRQGQTGADESLTRRNWPMRWEKRIKRQLIRPGWIAMLRKQWEREPEPKQGYRGLWKLLIKSMRGNSLMSMRGSVQKTRSSRRRSKPSAQLSKTDFSAAKCTTKCSIWSQKCQSTVGKAWSWTTSTRIQMRGSPWGTLTWGTLSNSIFKAKTESNSSIRGSSSPRSRPSWRSRGKRRVQQSLKGRPRRKRNRRSWKKASDL